MSLTTRPAGPWVALLLLLFLPGTHARETAPAPNGAQDVAAEARDATDAVSGSTVTRGRLESKIKEVEATGNLDETTKSRLTEYYRKALSSLEAATSYDAKAAAFAQAIETAPAQTQEIRRRLDAKPAAGEPEPLPDDLSLKEIEQRLAKEQADVAAVEAKVSEMEKELEAWSRRPAEARKRITEARTELEEIAEALARQVPEGESPTLTEARRWVLETRQRELRSEILMLDGELLSHVVREELLKAKRDKSARDLEMLTARKRFLEDELNERRRAQAEEARVEAETAKREAAGKHRRVEELAHKNAALTEELTVLAVALDRINDAQAEVEAQSKRIAEEFLSARQRLEISGLTQVLGRVLLDRRQQLPDQRIHRKAAKKRERDIADASLHQIRLNEERRRLRNLETYLDELTSDLGPEEQAGVRAELEELAEQRKALLDQALTTEDAYVRALGELDYASDQLLATADRYDAFLAERLLWVRNASPIGSEVFANLPGAITWLIWPGNWLEVAQVLVHESLASPSIWLVSLIPLALLWKSRAIHAAVLETAAPLRRVGTDRIGYTLQGLGLTVLLAAPWPLLTANLGWHLSSSLEATAFTKAVGQGALSAALGFFSLLAFRLLCMKGGVADRHFRWSERLLLTIRNNFDWALWILLPAGLLASIVYNFPDPRHGGSLGRITLLVLMLGFALFTARLIHPRSGVLAGYLLERPNGWVNRLRNVWFPILVAVPLFLALLTLVGYVYTAGTLLKSLVSELWLVLGLIVTHQVIVRWLVLTRRRLALQAANERRAEKAEGEDTASLLNVEEPEVDLASLDEQTRKLVNTLLFFGALVGLWVIWSDVLPAFAIFEDVALWHHTGIVDGQERNIPVTLADVGLVLLIAAIATVAVKNLPALLEILLLQRIALSSGSRYAVKTLTGYVIVAGAALIVFSTLGLSWSRVQWLVAALGVGIGFGLQEIVANFISGLIILFERPVRVGDIVTIGDTTGVVSRIQIRATTIRNWDKQELLVPNKEFITGRLLNWSLSDSVNRIVINIGVDYGSDVALALKLLTEAADENERVLADPAPLVTFEGFGDNALTLILRCYLESLDYRLAVTTELHQAINEKFQAAGISIAFPQRDVHLSTSEPLDVRVRNAWTEAREPSPPAPGGSPDAPGAGRK